MTPLEFLSFRDRLESGSGFQSHQFREIELALGLKDRRRVEHYPAGSAARARLEARYARPTLWDSFLRYLAQEGCPVPPEQLGRDVTRPIEPSAALQRALVELYRTNPLATQLCERLVDLDEGLQAWPDCGFDGQSEAWADAAEHVDDKWERAFAKAERVRRGFAALLDDADGDIALGASTHELLVRFLSALPLVRRPRLVTTDGEFHTVRRQLDRLAEAGIEVVKLPYEPAGTLAERLGAAVNERTAAAVVSAACYLNAHIPPGLGTALEACR